MTQLNGQNKKVKKSRSKFIDVDLHQCEYGEVSVKAIFSLYTEKSNCTPEEFRKTSFSDMIAFLREAKKDEKS